MKKSEFLIYLATPYSHDDRTIRAKRFMTACELTAALFKAGYMCFSPIAHTHPISEIGELPSGFEFWHDYDRLMIARCDVLLIVDMPGSSDSKGIKAETLIAQQLKKPVIYATEDEIRENKWAYKLQDSFLFKQLQNSTS